MIDELKARKNVPVKIWVPINEVESEALDQLKNVADLPYVRYHVAAMPDVHVVDQNGMFMIQVIASGKKEIMILDVMNVIRSS